MRIISFTEKNKKNKLNCSILFPEVDPHQNEADPKHLSK